jgi:hypothetical protein
LSFKIKEWWISQNPKESPFALLFYSLFETRWNFLLSTFVCFLNTKKKKIQLMHDSFVNFSFFHNCVIFLFCEWLGFVCLWFFLNFGIFYFLEKIAKKHVWFFSEKIWDCWNFSPCLFRIKIPLILKYKNPTNSQKIKIN